MKFSPAVIACVFRATFPARPVVVEDDDPKTFADAVNDVGDLFEYGNKYCKYDRNKEKIKNACSLPGNLSITLIQDDGWFTDTMEKCDNIQCCSPEAGMKGKRCLCVKSGGRYDKGPRTTEGKCCSKSGNDNGVCGCAGNGETLRFGGDKGDCCSGYMYGEKKKVCAKQPCTANQGQAPTDSRPCCRFKKELHSTKYLSPLTKNGKCECIHAGEFPATEVDGVAGSSCCSGIMTAGKCQCVWDSRMQLTDGALDSDCCSGHITKTDGKRFCLSTKCKGPGEKPDRGIKCCSGIEKDGVCGCLAPGKPVKEGKANQACCSLEASRADKKKCGYLNAGQPINKTFMDASVCSSGKIDGDGLCACFHDGEVSADASECCSGRHDGSAEASKCGCALAGVGLKYGAAASDCCSGNVVRAGNTDQCTCNFAGRPSRADGKDCCTKSAKGGFCGCFGPKDVLTEYKSTKFQCCGGFYNSSSFKCQCVPAGTAVASFVHDGACCGDVGGVVGGFCMPGRKEEKIPQLGR